MTLILAKIVVAAAARCLLYMFADGSVSAWVGLAIKKSSPVRYLATARLSNDSGHVVHTQSNISRTNKNRLDPTQPNPTRPNRLDADTLRYSMESLNCVPLRCLVLNGNDESVSGASNYCRNPDNSYGTLWCYTTHSGSRWEDCYVPLCDGQSLRCFQSILRLQEQDPNAGNSRVAVSPCDALHMLYRPRVAISYVYIYMYICISFMCIVYTNSI